MVIGGRSASAYGAIFGEAEGDCLCVGDRPFFCFLYLGNVRDGCMLST